MALVCFSTWAKHISPLLLHTFPGGHSSCIYRGIWIYVVLLPSSACKLAIPSLITVNVHLKKNLWGLAYPTHAGLAQYRHLYSTAWKVNPETGRIDDFEPEPWRAVHNSRVLSCKRGIPNRDDIFEGGSTDICTYAWLYLWNLIRPPFPVTYICGEQ